MKKRHSAFAVLCAFLLMGANDPLKSEITSTATVTASRSLASNPTTSIISKPTCTRPPKPAGGLTSNATTSMASKPTCTRATGSLSSGVTSSATTTLVCRPTVTQPAVTLSPYAEELAKILKFDRQVLIMVKEISGERIGRLVGFDAEGYQIIAPGISVPVPEDKTDRILAALRQTLVPRHYMPFVVEMNAGLKIDRIGILKGADQYEILRIMHTDGDDYDITNQDVIDRLKEWEKISSFEIIGADSDWVELEFKTLPRDLKAFVEEVYDFCPDAVDQGPGSVEALIRDIKKTNRLFLWWD